jgi:hypothetical protein
MNKSTKKRPRLGNPPPAPEADPVDNRDLLIAQLRKVEEWVRDSRVPIQGAFPAQASEALDNVMRANAQSRASTRHPGSPEVINVTLVSIPLSHVSDYGRSARWIGDRCYVDRRCVKRRLRKKIRRSARQQELRVRGKSRP